MKKRQNILENLELKLARTREEQAETVKQIEKNFGETYKVFLESIFEKDTLGFKRFIWAYFILDCVDGKTSKEAFESAMEKTLKQVPLQDDKKQELFKSIQKLEQKKDFIQENIIIEKNIKKDPNFPILESLEQQGVLENTDIAEIALQYKSGKNIIESTHFLSDTKREIITKNFYELNNTNTQDKIKHFEEDYKEEIQACPMIRKFPKVTKFIGRYYSKLKLKNKVESKKDRLKRMFKLAFLRLYRYKFSGIDIDKIIEQIESYSDLESMVNLLIKYFEVLKQNPELAEAYSILDEVENAENIANEAEGNKDKEIQSEKNILETSKIIEEIEEGLSKADIENLLSDEVDLVGDEFIPHPVSLSLGGEGKQEISSQETEAWIFVENIEEADSEEVDEKITKDDLEEKFKQLREELFELEDRKRKCFAEGKYDEIDEINDELIALWKKADKLKKLLWIWIDDEYTWD